MTAGRSKATILKSMVIGESFSDTCTKRGNEIHRDLVQEEDKWERR